MEAYPIWHTHLKNEHNIIEDYGQFELTRIHLHEEKYINNPTRSAQDDHMIHECLINFISVTVKSKVNFKLDEAFGKSNAPLWILCIQVIGMRSTY